MRLGSDMSGEASLTARVRGYRSAEEYAAWIEADAHARQAVPFWKQRFWTARQRDHSLFGRAVMRMLRPLVDSGRSEWMRCREPPRGDITENTRETAGPGGREDALQKS
jgi:hypothetical protein